MSLSIPPRENETTHQKSTQRQTICRIPQLSADQSSPWGLCWQSFPTVPFHSLLLTSSLDCSKYTAAQATRLEKRSPPSQVISNPVHFPDLVPQVVAQTSEPTQHRDQPLWDTLEGCDMLGIWCIAPKRNPCLTAAWGSPAKILSY